MSRTNRNKSICAICCETFSKRQNNVGTLLQLQKVCSSLSTTTFNVDDTTTKDNNVKNCGGEKRKLREQVNSSSIWGKTIKLSTTICLRCLDCISSTLTKRDQLNSMEVEVRQLQIRILRLLKYLQGNINTFKREVNKIDKIVKESCAKVSNLDCFDCSDNKEEEEDRKDVIQFREKVLTVVEDLRNFCNGRGDIHVTEGTHISSTASAGANDTANGPQEITSACQRKPIESVLTSPLLLLPNTGEEELNEGAGAVSISRARKVPSATIKLKSNANHDDDNHDDDNHDDDNHDDDNHEDDNLNDDNLEDDNLDDDNRDANHDDDKPCLDLSPEHSGDEDDMNGNDKSALSRDSAEASSKNCNDVNRTPAHAFLLRLGTLEFAKMASFKHALLTRVFKRIRKHEMEKELQAESTNQQEKTKTKKTNAFDAVDPKKTHFITYEPKTDILSLGDIEIDINDQDEFLKCSKCDFKSYQTKDGRTNNLFENDMYDHIVGHHLKLFSCPFCTRNIATYSNFRRHVISHGVPHICDICGKPLRSLFSLNNHKWFHLNEEEKAEAVKNGVKPPQSTQLKRRDMEKKFVCSTCGKGFIYMAYLKKHEEEIHLREGRHMCPHCGRRFNYHNGLQSHLKIVCRLDKDKHTQHTPRRFHCDQCPQKFVVQSKLNRHKGIHHPTGPPTLIKCSLCEKMFKSKEKVKIHEKTHSDARPFLCKKGCGATYKTKKHCQRHEKLCTNSSV